MIFHGNVIVRVLFEHYINCILDVFTVNVNIQLKKKKRFSV